jgi:hypothetical protein
LFSAICILLFTISAFAVPNSIPYSGRAVKNGILINTPQAVTINLYTQATGAGAGDPFYTTTNLNVPFVIGIYSIDFGPLDPSLLVGKDTVYLETTIAGETLMQRTKTNASVFAFQSGGLSHNGASVSLDTNGNVIISGSLGIATMNSTVGLSVSGNVAVSNGLTVGMETTGNAVQGTMRWNPSAGQMEVWDGGQWQ